jgi:hypothetical protein
MIQRLKRFIAISTLVLSFGVMALAVPSVGAVNAVDDEACKQAPDSLLCKGANRSENANDLVKTIVNTLLFVVGAISVVVIIVGGIMYTVSAGDSGAVTRAKNTIMYAVVGLVVSFLAYAIVNFVLDRLK